MGNKTTISVNNSIIITHVIENNVIEYIFEQIIYK